LVATPGRTRDFLLITTGYLAALLAAWLTVGTLDAHPLFEVFVAGFVSTLVIFTCSSVFGNSSFYDAYWSVAPPLFACYFVMTASDADALRQLLVCAVVLIWAVRLTGNWAYGWTGMQHEDWRYENLAGIAGRLWWLLSLTGVHLFPTVMILLGSLPLYPALSAGTAPVGWLDGLALLIGLSAVWLEFQADKELHQFRAERSSRAQVLDHGVWAWCRHPNYLGEIGFWVSLFLFGVAAWGGIYPWSWLGPVSMLVLFVGISIPMIERKLMTDKPEYAAYRARVKMLIPRLL
jgi:steroid 5-alpha reductase family enzyme